MKASIDDGRCRGHGVCTTVCPDVFAMTDDGYAEAIVDEVPAGLEDSAREAADACPENAVILSD
ncbi:ferredoxin [Mycobacterium crocinum]|jgi:ferredoxin|uniref:Ferredoxin n=2 Tax=Mycolicibacterium TaxID=1866885 RepID=A0ABX8VA17_9MYCO|nr:MULTISPECIES: ferredoxin [Mycolicibacterium]MCV7214080.1 ferredoxin [Mycolicibacterium crocinum]QYL14635.1 ferredoxin [Mycolicibacterium pallens]ULN39374.1 ferredoxin [Mycolicibacterium crocinum]